jgi:hypothetical protein
MLLSLSEELLDRILPHLAYRPLEPFYSPGFPLHLVPKQASAALISLSLVNRQLRRISTPFLFAYIRAHTLEWVQRLAVDVVEIPGLAQSVQFVVLVF